MEKIRRPALRYCGGKWRIAPWIISHFPRHDNFVTPFAGGLSVLLRKPMVKLETANDLDGRVMNFFTVLRERPGNLITAIRGTPWAESEYKNTRVIADLPLEDARRFFCHCWMSIHGGPTTNSGFRLQRSLVSRGRVPPDDVASLDHLWVVADRLRHVQFLNRDARKVIEFFVDEESCLIYCDPPYLKEVRSGGARYVHDSTVQLHIDLAALVRRCKGFVIVSGYECTRYEELYGDWHRVERETQVQSGAKRIESLWLSPRTVEELERERLPLLAGMMGGSDNGTTRNVKRDA